MFKCKLCIEKDRIIELLRTQVLDLHDRLMAYNREAFTAYKQENKSNDLPPLYPMGIDSKGKLMDYKDMDKEKAEEDIVRAFGEEFIEVDDKEGA